MDNLNENKRKLEVVATGKQEDETCQTFVMHYEDHTLGNSLRYMIMKKDTIRVNSLDPDQTQRFLGPDLGPNCLQTTKEVTSSPDVQFCGYSIPHPSESKINFRVQTYGKPANDILRKGLKDLNVVCEHVLRTFETSVNEHKRRNQSSDIEMVDQSNG